MKTTMTAFIKTAFIKTASFGLVPSLALLTVACSSMDDGHGVEDVLLFGDVTDETMMGMANALEAAEPVVSSLKSPTLDYPLNDESLTAGTIPTFTWHVGASSDAARTVSGASGPMATEPAHGDPFSGYATYLEFMIGMDAPMTEVLTSELSWTPSQEVWDTFVAADQPIMLMLIGAEFEQDRVIQDGGPYEGSVIEFEVTP